MLGAIVNGRLAPAPTVTTPKFRFGGDTAKLLCARTVAAHIKTPAKNTVLLFLTGAALGIAAETLIG
jgi:hypothetical protein